MVKKITQQPTGLKWVPVITLSSLCAFMSAYFLSVPILQLHKLLFFSSSDISKLEILYFVFSMVLLTNIDFSMSKGTHNMVKATRGSKYC